MGNKMFFWLGVLIIFISAACFVFYRQYAEIQQLKKDAADAEKLLKEHNKQKQTPEVVDVADNNRPPPPGKSFEGDGHWHGNQWHDKPHTAQPIETNFAMSETEIAELNTILDRYGIDSEKLTRKQWLYLSEVGVSWDKLTPEQQRQSDLAFYAEHGLNPPPEGYEYKFKTLGIPYLDESGNAIIRKIGNPNTTKSFGGYLREVTKE